MMAIKIIQKAVRVLSRGGRGEELMRIAQRFAANPKTMQMIEREVEIMKKLDHVRPVAFCA